MSKKIIIVGGVAGGATAAARLRRIDETSDIVMFEKGEHISFANCGLPYYIGGTIDDREKLLVQTVEGMSRKFNLDIRNLTEVTAINRNEKTVTVKRVQTGETYTEAYDELILSPGARPIVPLIPGLNEAKQLFTLRNVPDTDQIKAWVDGRNPQKAVVIGGGFIGLEMAENLHDLGIEVTVVEMADQVMASLDYEMASIVHEHIRTKANLILNDGVKSFEHEGSQIQLQSGETLTSDLTILSIGVQPENELAKNAGLAIGDRGGIVVNDYMQTDDPHVYAIGDAVEVKDYNQKTPTMVPLAWPANRQGRIVADTIYGKKTRYKGTLGTSIAKVFDYTAAATGNNEKTLKKLGVPYKAVHVHPASHAGYYPGGSPVSLKMTFDPEDGRIFGVQGVGMDGVDKRIDVLATAIKGGLTVFDLPELELAYAPPYGSAKDPVNMLGYVASHVADGDLTIVHHDEIDQIVADGGFLVDVRDPLEVEMGAIPGSVNIPLDEIRDRISEFPDDQPVYITCQVGLRGYLATRILEQHGKETVNLSGGYKTYACVNNDCSPSSLEEAPESEENGADFAAYQHQQADQTIDATGLSCPGPIMNLHKAVKGMDEGQTVKITVTDPGFIRDVDAWCKSTGHTLIEKSNEKNNIYAVVAKGTAEKV
ncbi:CoA-disulfide reductase [Salisediminibacterium halotolerans]|uniref:CoA-disulfide reductase n=1 Tax=Salisediminibacterium halotolerans TaxID=517425 RepID=A0A1H9V2C6_9BACI|nr:CoA-disulfide reductase [Salisediminibacterium haloalkalitolerans]SES15855.1 CoA-disulfide reductase [Salisediminibacterium haloalkalitolerans]